MQQLIKADSILGQTFLSFSHWPTTAYICVKGTGSSQPHEPDTHSIHRVSSVKPGASQLSQA